MFHLLFVILSLQLATGSILKSNPIHRFLRAAAPLPIALSLMCPLANAQIPSMDDFYTSSGTKIVDKSAPMIRPAQSNVEFQSFSQLDPILTSLESMVMNEQWDDIVREIKSNSVLKQMKADTPLSFIPSQSPPTMQKISELREDFNFNLRQVSDAALSNRVVYFNKADLNQVYEMLNEGGSSASGTKKGVEELGMLKAAMQAVRGLSEVQDGF